MSAPRRSRGTFPWLGPAWAGRALRWGLLGPAVAGWLAVGSVAPAVCQERSVPEPLAGELPWVHDRAARDRLYDALAADVAELERRGNILKRVVKLVTPAVVHIEAHREAEPMRVLRGDADEAGSGVIIERFGRLFVLTNRHVVKHTSPANLHLKLADGRVLHPRQVWSDAGTDVAVLAIEGSDLATARLGDSSQLEIGDFVLAVGSPFGLSHSVTLGILSAKGRRDLRLGDDSVPYQDFLQTDAAINPGNSGGPLLNLRGEVVGLTTAIASTSGANEGIGFAIPINMVMQVADQLIQRGAVVRAFLGVRLDASYGASQAAQLGLGWPRGARVSGVTRHSPAEQAQLRVGDIILQFDGTNVEDDVHLINLVSLAPLDRQIPIRLRRDGQTLEVWVRLANRASVSAE